MCLSCWLCAALACAPTEVATAPLGQGAAAIRNVRVLIGSGVDRARLRAEGALVFGGGPSLSLNAASEKWIIVDTGSPHGLRLGDTVWPDDEVVVRPEGSDLLAVSFYREGQWQPQRIYPGSLRFWKADNGGLDVINAVDVERYVASVVASEIWPGFETEAFRAQAIVARTFVLYQMQRRQSGAFDVTAGQSSQVYRGVRADATGRRASEATAWTRGIVLTHERDGRAELFPAYYSAACGGCSQSASIFGAENDVPPLRGGVRCDYCKIAPKGTYRWGPVRFTKREIALRLQAAFPELESLGSLDRLEIVERTASGRAVRVRIHGKSGKSVELLGERFRLAIGGNDLHSTDFQMHMAGEEVVFDHGKGFGHGLGLCQWGMEGQALEGKKAGSILRYYFPGATLSRVY